MLALEMSVNMLNTGDVIDIYPYDGVVKRHNTTKEEVVSRFKLKSEVMLDEVRAGGWINLIIGKLLKARASLGLLPTSIFRSHTRDSDKQSKEVNDYTLAQKIIGRACQLPEGKGVLPGMY